MTEIVEKYFDKLDDTQRRKFLELGALYRHWNEMINVISRKDIDNLYERHVLHSLAIAKIINFTTGTTIMDVGTGGGFPGIPLAIMFPDCKFYLIDRVGKKIKVATNIAYELGLKNVTTKQAGVEEEKNKFDFVVSRATMPLPELFRLCRKNISNNQRNSLPNGIITLKGGELQKEISPFKNISVVYDISENFKEEFFATKKIVYLPISNR